MNNLDRAKEFPSQEKLWEMFDYDPETGQLSNKETEHVYGSRKYKTNSYSKYIFVRFGGKCYYAHRLIWTMVHGPIPKGMSIDHINLNCRDNRISNLRLATPSQQQQNRNGWGKIGYRGVNCIAGKYYSAQIRARGQVIYLGCFSTPEEASAAYDEAVAKYHGQFARPTSAFSAA